MGTGTEETVCNSNLNSNNTIFVVPNYRINMSTARIPIPGSSTCGSVDSGEPTRDNAAISDVI